MLERVADDEVLLEVAPERPLDWLTELPRRVVPLPTEFVVPLSPDVEREGAPVTVVLRDGPELGRVAAPPSTPTLLLPTLLLLTPPLPDVALPLPAELFTTEPALPREG